MIGRADIEGSKSNVAMNAWLPQASYPCGTVKSMSFFEHPKALGWLDLLSLGSISGGPDYILSLSKVNAETDRHLVVELHP